MIHTSVHLLDVLAVTTQAPLTQIYVATLLANKAVSTKTQPFFTAVAECGIYQEIIF